MNNEDYLKNVLLTESKDFVKVKQRLSDNSLRILHGLIGLSTESAESLDILKKHLFYGKELDSIHLAEELSDCLWYISIAADAIGTDLSKLMQMNHDKLKKRYPLGFTETAAKLRADKI